MILSLGNQDLSLVDICPVGATFPFAFFPLEVSETTISLDYSVLLNNMCIVLPPTNALVRLRLSANTAPAAPFKCPYDTTLIYKSKSTTKANQVRTVKLTASPLLVVQKSRCLVFTSGSCSIDANKLHKTLRFYLDTRTPHSIFIAGSADE
ncbi:hypothetical protein BHM03_00057302 [Ensete ventricosum]|nr:hypothetical protein BHM03_00057302 [Ensete ventricosum]